MVEPVTFGVLWSLVAASIAAVGSPWLLRPAGESAEELGDRFLVAMVVAGIGALGATALLGRVPGWLIPQAAVADVVFWVAGALGVVAYSFRVPREAFSTLGHRLSSTLPWVLCGVGVYVAMCWVRATCAAVGGASRPGAGPELVVGVLLIGLGIALHRLWLLGHRQRLLIGVVAIIAWRLALGDLDAVTRDRPVTLAVAGAAALLVFAGWIRRRPDAAWQIHRRAQERDTP